MAKIRASKVVKEFNIALSTLVEFLHKKGIEIESNPGAVLSEDAYALVEKEFAKEHLLKEQSRKVAISVKEITESEHAKAPVEEPEEVIIKTNVLDSKPFAAKSAPAPKPEPAPPLQPLSMDLVALFHWPQSTFWKWFSYLFPSTFGCQAFINLNTAGADLEIVAPQLRALCVQGIAYFVAACGAVYVENSVIKRKDRIEEVRKDVEQRIGSRIGVGKTQI